ncbi:LysE/ArgO family amino acid transporter [Demequina sp. NBRC 110055]|uniref:LysE/ArgO family amino acid transporter n=1 Tax=Demequina sp. NBRC 110055 TaxID=1570344 RepID=UPI0009FBDDCC|nr:LysE/ArgO family amino acid transporter [Demequina sp. NBRC 110055]
MIFLAGLGLGLSLIAAIGAQNVFVIRQGIRREHVLAVIVVCAGSDAVLISVGTAGLGALIGAHAWVETAARVGGALFLATYAVFSARRAWRGAEEGLRAADARVTGRGMWAAVGTTLAITWLNPHVYLDTVVLLGSVAGTYGEAKWAFAAGAMVGSLAWFTALGYGARLLSGVLARPGAWRVLDGVVAVVMATLAVSLILGA